MSTVLITGSGGLIGSQAVEFFADKFDVIAGLDNDMRKIFFGPEASTAWNVARLKTQVPSYRHHTADIQNVSDLEPVFQEYGSDISLVVHTAAQPSHDWAATDPFLDFSVNASGTLNVLEMTRKHCPEAVFIFTSTNKVYGDRPNTLPLIEHETRWEASPDCPYFEYGIDEEMSIDQSKHSLFGVSKVAADVMVQEYGRYFGMKTGVFRGGCLTGPSHSGAKLHGFLSYLFKCAMSGEHYSVFGYKGKQVRDNIHSFDLVNMFWHFYQNPRCGEVYNAGGSRHSNCSMQEAIALAEEICGKKMNYSYCEDHRIGDHIWYISDVRKFQQHFPEWSYRYSLREIGEEIYNALTSRAT